MTNELQRHYSEIRERNRRLWERRYSECIALDPRIATLYEERGRILMQLGQGKLNETQAHSRLAAIVAERKNRLIGLGKPSIYLEPIYTCTKCRDTGEVGDTLKRPCACALQQMQKYMADGAGVQSQQTFATFSDAIYPTEEQRRRALAAKKYCVQYAEALPSPERPFFILMGESGRGKTFLANAIAYAALERGIEATMVTAYRLVQDALDGIQTRTEPMKRYATVPLLVVDDLGSEPDIPTVTVESFYRVFNERLVKNLPTVVATNLSAEELSARYGERIVSRLLDGRRSSLLLLKGDNLRGRKY